MVCILSLGRCGEHTLNILFSYTLSKQYMIKAFNHVLLFKRGLIRPSILRLRDDDGPKVDSNSESAS